MFPVTFLDQIERWLLIVRWPYFNIAHGEYYFSDAIHAGKNIFEVLEYVWGLASSKYYYSQNFIVRHDRLKLPSLLLKISNWKERISPLMDCQSSLFNLSNNFWRGIP